ncbi:MAG: POTRA domain-containing protein [Candidatus Binatia bacterium]
MCSNGGGVLLRIVLLGAILARGQGRAQEHATDPLGQPIVAIEFTCTAPIDVPGLTQLMPMKMGDPLRSDDIKEARWRLKQSHLFTKVAIDPQPRGSGVAVVIHLVRKPIVNRIRFEGNHALSDRELQRIVRLRESMALTGKLRDYSVERIQKRYVAEGFDASRVEAEVRTRSPGEVDVIFHIDEGEPLRVGVVEVEGTLPLPEGEVRKLIGIRVGDRYARDRQRAADKAVVRRLRDKGYYEAEVESKWQRGLGEAGTLHVRVDPGPSFRIEFSGTHHFSDHKLLDLIELPKRPIITDGTWRELARRAQHAYQEKGYYFAKVDVKIDAGPPKGVRFTIDEGRTFHVTRVDFEGNRSVSTGELRAIMATRPPSWIPWRRGTLLDDVLDDDLKRLWYLYRRHGFESAEIVDERRRFDQEKGEVFISIIVDEGRQTIVRRVERNGVEPIAESLPKFALEVGQPFDAEKVDSDRRALLTALAKAGYTHAKVETRVGKEVAGEIQAATVYFEATPMEQQRVGTMIVQNNFDTRASVMLRELPFQENNPLNPEALLQGQTNIYKLGIFRSVTVRPLRVESEPEPVPDSERPVVPEPGMSGGVPGAPPQSGATAAKPNYQDIVVSVAGKPPGSLQWGAGYNTRDGFRGFVEVSHDNLQGLARRLSLRGDFNLQPGDLTPNEYLGNLGFREPQLNGTKWIFRSNLIGQRSTRSVDQFSLERFALISALERTVLPGLQVGVETQIEQAQVFNLAPDVVHFNGRDQGRLRTMSVGPFAIYDGRDDPFVPRRGVFDSLRVRVAPRQFGTDIPLVKVSAQHAQYVPLGDEMTFVYVARTGWARAYDDGDTVPIRERFFLGGRTTVRGFSENQIGPKGNAFTDDKGSFVPGGDPLGGSLALNLNTELRFPLLYGFGGVVFADGGGVYLENRTGATASCSGCGSVSIHDFRRSSGLGLRYITPVGPISLDYGFKLDRRADESIGEVHFSVGTTF